MSDTADIKGESPAEKARRCAAILGELTEMGLSLARDLHGRALAAESAQEAQALGLAFQRVSRSVRQSLALELKVERDLALEAREAEVQAQEAAQRAELDRADRAARRQNQVHTAMNRLLWTEADQEEEAFDDLSEDLNARLEEAALAEDFLETPLEVLVARLARDMDLPADPDADPASGSDSNPDAHESAPQASSFRPTVGPLPDSFVYGGKAWAAGRGGCADDSS